jgi:hypothetical protein
MSRAVETQSYRMRHPDYVERQHKHKRTVYYQLKQEAITVLGGKCCHCQCSDIRCLEIDHIVPVRGDRSLYGVKLYRSVAQGNTEGLQVLCACCHAIKTYEDGNGIL